ncbi:MAG: methyltransferase domain-containing protein [Thermoplasmata archaeon]
MNSDFDRQLADAATLPFSGWDFSVLTGRWRRGNPPWDYAALLREKMRAAASMVDLGTGGGEFFASLAPLPETSFATDGYPPNVAVAQRRLAPLGVRVLPIDSDLHIDLPDQSMDLVACRHEDFSASETLRILRPGKWFITQQTGPRNNIEIQARFGTHPPPPTNHLQSLAAFAAELAGAGFEVRQTAEAVHTDEFLDVGAVVYYLRAIPWEVPDFSMDRNRETLREIYQEIQRTGSFRVTTHRLLVTAQRPE